MRSTIPGVREGLVDFELGHGIWEGWVECRSLVEGDLGPAFQWIGGFASWRMRLGVVPCGDRSSEGYDGAPQPGGRRAVAMDARGRDEARESFEELHRRARALAGR